LGADGGLDYGAFLWSPVNGLQSLGALPNDPDSSASGINDAGQVVGMSGASAIPTAFLYSNGQMVSLGALPGGQTSGANAINDAGQVVGWSSTASGPSDAFVDSNGVMTDLNSLVPAGSGLTLVDGIAINNSGQIAADAVDAAGDEHAVLLTPVASPSFTVTGFPSPTTAGVAGSFTVTAENANGTTNTGYAGTVQFTSSDPRAVLPANYTFTAADQGVHTFSATLKTAGSQSLTATDTATASVFGTLSDIAVTPAAATHFVITGPTSVTAGTAFSITGTALDAYGNIATGYAGTVDFTSSDTTATLPSNYTFKAADKGVHTFTGLKLKKKGKQTITVKDTKTGSIEQALTITVD